MIGHGEGSTIIGPYSDEGAAEITVYHCGVETASFGAIVATDTGG